MADDMPTSDPSWRRKFRDAFRGQKRGFRGESGFFVHFFVAAMVIVAAVALGADRNEWCLLLLCITLVLTAEMLNSAVERLARAIDQNYNAHLRDALDIAAGAVLTAAIGAAILGVVILGRLILISLGLPTW
jgi:diacylglycerol kinase